MHEAPRSEPLNPELYLPQGVTATELPEGVYPPDEDPTDRSGPFYRSPVPLEGESLNGQPIDPRTIGDHEAIQAQNQQPDPEAQAWLQQDQ